MDIFRKKTERRDHMITGLAPMDGITDAAFRQITDLYGHPDLLFTEFVPVEAVAHGRIRVLLSLQRHKTKTTTIAQLFGRDLKSFYKSSIIAAELGFDGIDINMGCPDKNIAKKGGGAGLIYNPSLAVQIINTVKQAVSDWFLGCTLEEAGISDETRRWIQKHRTDSPKKRILPVSVKTRTGLDSPITEQWIDTLVKAKPHMITLHGRTLTQLYRGKADWNEIKKASLIAHAAGILLLGNGDIQSLSQARLYSEQYGCDGVLIGRAALGNPWVFSEITPSAADRKKIIIEHCRLFLEYRAELQLYPMRKHLAWYATGFPGSRTIRNRLMKIVTLEDVESVVQDFPV